MLWVENANPVLFLDFDPSVKQTEGFAYELIMDCSCARYTEGGVDFFGNLVRERSILGGRKSHGGEVRDIGVMHRNVKERFRAVSRL